MSVPEREMSEKAREGKMVRTGLVRKVAVRLARMSGCYKREWRSQKRKYKRRRARLKQISPVSVCSSGLFVVVVKIPPS